MAFSAGPRLASSLAAAGVPILMSTRDATRGPVSGGRLDDAELIAVGIGENMPAPPELPDRLVGEQDGAGAQDTPDLGLEIWRAQVEVKAVLVPLLVRHPLQQD